ncbi:MAG: glycosyltransferase family 9 protein [Chlamydiae bacterium]|nr:glycosyltransferase family 9 protein [Chlamydiota bacterium]
MQIKKNPLTGKYLVQNQTLFLLLKFIDRILSFLVEKKKEKKLEKGKKEKKEMQRSELLCNPIILKKKRILVCNIAHLGDVIIATAILPILKQKFGDCHIGFLTSSASKVVIEGHKLINVIHEFNHFRLNRGNNLLKKIFQHIQSKKKVIKELKEESYDIAIDLYYFFPNSISIIAKAKIPMRIGYTSGGFGPLLTHSLDWSMKDHYVGFYHLQLLKFLDINFENYKPKPNLSEVKEIVKDRVEGKILEKGYVIFHLGSGHHLKEWPLEKYKAVTKKLVKKGINIIFTGKGEQENKNINEVIQDEKRCLNLCDKLSWAEFAFLVKKAKVILCVDTAINHLTTALDVTTVCLYSGINNFHHWRYPSENNIALMKTLSCTFCYNNKGCEKMSCIRDISVEAVYETLFTIINFNQIENESKHAKG